MAVQFLNLGFLTFFLHSVLSIAFILRLTPIFLKSSSTLSGHLFLGIPLHLPPQEYSVALSLAFCDLHYKINR
jgi:hypothetical protein